MTVSFSDPFFEVSSTLTRSASCLQHCWKLRQAFDAADFAASWGIPGDACCSLMSLAYGNGVPSHMERQLVITALQDDGQAQPAAAANGGGDKTKDKAAHKAERAAQKVCSTNVYSGCLCSPAGRESTSRVAVVLIRRCGAEGLCANSLSRHFLAGGCRGGAGSRGAPRGGAAAAHDGRGRATAARRHGSGPGCVR